MSLKIPNTWKLVRCQDVVDVRDGTHDTPAKVSSGIPLITSKNLKPEGIDFSDVTYISEFDHQQIEKRSRVDDGDILFAMIGTIGNPMVVEKDRPFSIKNVALFKLGESQVVPKYFKYLLSTQFLKQQLDVATRGGTQKFVSLQMLRNLIIPLPPIAEQKRIAAILDKAEELRGLRRKALGELDAVVQSIFIEMFGDPITDSKGWSVSQLRAHTLKIGSGATPTGGDSAYKETGISLIRSLNVRNGKFSLKDLAFIDNEQASKLSNVVVKVGDVLLNITGASVARVCRVPSDVLPARVNQHVAIIRPKSTLNEVYLEQMLLYPSFKQILLKTAEAGATRQAITKLQIEGLCIPVPPLPLQEEFARRVGAIEHLKTTHRESLAQLNALFASLQHRAFRGEL